MDRIELMSGFAGRLNEQVEKKISMGSFKGGSKINHLAEAASVSYQMARKYLLGLALPELHVIYTVAEWLEITPSWLLFGECSPNALRKPGKCIEIELGLLEQLLKKCSVLFPTIDSAEQILTYISDMIYDASHLNTDKETTLKIIDMMLSSAVTLNKISERKIA